jgi:hypothetical protein
MPVGSRNGPPIVGISCSTCSPVDDCLRREQPQRQLPAHILGPWAGSSTAAPRARPGMLDAAGRRRLFPCGAPAESLLPTRLRSTLP